MSRSTVSRETREEMMRVLARAGYGSDAVYNMGVDFAAWLLVYIVNKKLKSENGKMNIYTISGKTVKRLRNSGTYVRDGYSVADVPLETLLVALLNERDDLLASIEYLEGGKNRTSEKVLEK